MLSAGVVDLALTYNPAAEKLLLDSGDAIESLYAYRVSVFSYLNTDTTLRMQLLS